tara:strand:- start:454 stop:729 length:276 start_codon:yes stop_codon:yes gene_type:complete
LNKADIVNILAKEKNLKISDAEEIVSIIIEDIAKILILGGRAEFRGFGVFFTNLRKKRSARNPKTGEAVDVKAKRIPQFKMSKNFFKKINQ